MTITWPLPQQAVAVFRSGNIAQALAIADGVLSQDPASADALLTRAMIRLTQGAINDALPDLQAAAELRSGDWLFERLRAEISARNGLSLPLQEIVKLGAFVRSHLSPVGPPIGDGRREATPDLVNVVGTGMVRSFGGNTSFFPVLAGSGAGLSLLTDEAAALTRERMLETLKRVDPACPTILVLGGDVQAHLENALKTRKNLSAPLGRGDYALMEKVAERHRPLLAAARKVVKGRLLLLGNTPTIDDRANALARRLNRQLAMLCREMRIGFLDLWGDLVDPVTGRLAERMRAKATPSDNGLVLGAASDLFVKKLKVLGVIDRAAPALDYAWTHAFECDLGTGEKTRVWCEPGIAPANAAKSHKIAAAHLYGKLADLLASTLVASGPQPALYINVRDGYLPATMPPALISRSVALTIAESDARMARVLLDFWGRSDVVLRQLSPDALSNIANFQPSLVVGATYPDTVEGDIDAINTVLAARRPVKTLALALADPAYADRIRIGGYKVLARVALGQDQSLPDWQKCTVFLLQGSA